MTGLYGKTTSSRRRLPALLGVLAVGLLAAAWSRGPAAPEPAAYTLHADAAPFAYRVVMAGAEAPAQHRADTAGTALFYLTAGGAQYLTTPVVFDTTAVRLHAVYETTDGRRATVGITPQSHGGFRLALTVDPADGILGVGETLAARPGEHFHGLTQRTVGDDDYLMRDPATPVTLGRRGHDVALRTQGTIALDSPFYLSSAGYGLFVEGTWTGRFNMAEADTARVRFVFDGPSLAYQVFPGPDPAHIVEHYTEVVGRPLMPPAWAFASWRWRDDHRPRSTYYDGSPYRGPYNAQVVEDVLMMEALDIPLAAYWVDRPWAIGDYGYDDFVWDRKRLPNPEAMVRWLDGRGVRFLLWIAPWVMGDMAVEALEKEYFLPSTQFVKLGMTRASQANDPAYLRTLKPALLKAVEGRSLWGLGIVAQPAPGALRAPGDDRAAPTTRDELRRLITEAETLEELRRLLLLPTGGRVLVDFTNPDAVAWWQGYLDTVLDDGVAGFKLDRADEIVPDGRRVYAHDGRSLAEVHNLYPVLYARAVHDAVRRHRGDDFTLIARAGYAGSLPYTAFWGGDSHNTWQGLRNAVVGGLRAGLMGYAFWGSDTGGYFTPTRRELMARWLALSAFSPIMEVGPTSNRAPWDMPTGPRYDAELIATWRLYAKLHDHLRDYTYRYAQEAHATGHPIMRPLFYHYPDDPRAWEVSDAYLYGEDYLVAPVLQKEAAARTVYLPAGDWIDYWNPDRIYHGPTTVAVETPFHKTPIFLRRGSTEEILDLEALYRESLALAKPPPVLPDGSGLPLPE